MRSTASVALAATSLCGGCQAFDILGLSGQDVVRRSGQVELFYVDYARSNYRDDATAELDRRLSMSDWSEDSDSGHVGQLRPAMTWDSPKRVSLLGDDGESIRYPDDIVTIQVHGGFLYSLPWTLTASTDIVLFAEVWENAAVGPGARSLNSIVHIGRAQMPEARMNFEGALAYGPTNFKGHPLKIKFTLMVLQRSRGEQMSNTTEVLQNLVSASGGASAAGILSSEAIGVVRQILRSQPDVEAFDFEATLISDEPEMLQETLLGDGQDQLFSVNAEWKDRRSNAADQLPVDPSELDYDEMLLAAALLELTDTIYMDSFSPERFLNALENVQDSPSGKAWLTQHSIDVEPLYKSIAEIEDYLGGIHGEDYRPSDRYVLDSRSDMMPDDVRSALIPIAFLDRAIIRYLNRLAGAESGFDENPGAKPTPRERRPGPQRLNWLRYGTFALVETKPRSSNRSFEYIDSSHFFWYDGYRVMGNSIACIIPEPSGSGFIRNANANYIIFSIVPRQLEQHQSSLRAASDLSDNLLQLLRTQEGNDPGTLARAAADGFTESIDRNALLHIARETARKFNDESLVDVMRERHMSYIDTVIPTEKSNSSQSGSEMTRRQNALQYADSIQSMWEWRVMRHQLHHTTNNTP